jgi:hypothetical protein
VTHTGYRFAFDVPDTWAATDDGRRFSYRGPLGEELMVSGNILVGSGTVAERNAIRDALVQNGKQTMARAAEHEDLVTIKELREDVGAVNSPLRCWTVLSKTKDAEIQFDQAVVASDQGVLLITLEAPHSGETMAFFRGFLKTIQPALTN